MSDPTAAGDPLDQIIADYLQAAEAGRVPSRQALLDAHPEFADRLRAFFADYDRLDNRADALKLAADRPSAERPKVRYFGDYELLEEIAEGGMGLVYKARQETLGRVVALKLVRAGRLAKPIDIARFRIEAEAAAGLDHPNIVPLYEVGEHDGQQYLAMKFIDGPSLAKLPRGDVRAEVALMEKVARAVDFAHRQGILHRDLKPSNILTDAAGTPYVTDFGLAKRIDAELSLTESGQMLGTAGYVAPEQALGKKGLTVTADVFSLGAVLFERLTGTPAFPGGTILERLRSLHDSATPRPTVLMPTLPRDLETVVLKCLEREPGKRYATAGMLADDLARWLRGEPIVARRVTAAERCWLWCRRNPTVAGLSGAAAVLLMAGTGVSSYFAVQANRRAVEAEQARDEAKKARDRAERSQLDHVLQAFGKRAKYSQEFPTPTGPAIRHATLELAELTEDRIRTLYLELALADPDTTPAVGCGDFDFNTERVAQAVVGASDSRRKAALTLLLAKQNDASADAQIRAAACRLALELGSCELPVHESWFWGGPLHNNLSADRLTVQQVGRLHSACLAALSAPPPQVSGSSISTVLAKIAPALDGASAIQASDGLVAALGKAEGEYELGSIAYNLAALAPRLDRHAAARASDGLVAALGKVSDTYPVGNVAWALAVFAPWLDEPAATRASNGLVGALVKDSDWYSRRNAAGALAALAPRVDGPAAVRAWDGLVELLGKTVDHDDVDHADWAAARGLVALAPRLDRPAAAQAWEKLVHVLGTIDDGDLSQTAAQAFTGLAPRLDRSAVTKASDALVGSLTETAEHQTIEAAGEGLAALAPYLDPSAAARAWTRLVWISDKNSYDSAIEATAKGIAALAPRLDGQFATQAGDDVIRALGNVSDRQTFWAACSAMATLAPRLDPPAAARAWKYTAAVLGKTRDGYVLDAAAASLTVLAPRLTRPAAIRSGAALAEALNATTGVPELKVAVQGLTALAPQLDASTASRAWDAVAKVVANPSNKAALQVAADSLAALAPRLDPPTAIRASGHLVDLLTKTNDNDVRKSAAKALTALAPGIDAPAAARACAGLIKRGDERYRHWVDQEIKAVAALAPRLDSVVAVQAADRVLLRMPSMGLNTDLAVARTAVMALSEKMEPKERQACRARMGKAAVEALRHTYGFHRLDDGWRDLCLITDQLDSVIERLIASGKFTFDDIGEVIFDNHEPPQVNGYQVSPSLFAATADMATVADCLRHPDCIGRTRQLVLHRLEELAFPPSAADARQAVAESVVTGLTQPLAGGVLAAGRQAKWERQRRFRTTWDAVAWLREHHPEIDLDKPYTPRK